jgi:transcriptional activator HAC1
MESKNIELQQQIERMASGMTVFRQSSPAHPEQLRSTSPVTLSQELFESSEPQRTVNPASISPEIRPVDLSNASFSDMTQHPAAMLCDLQCQSDEQRPWMSTSPSATMYLQLAITLCLSMTSALSSTILSPLTQIVNSLEKGSSLTPTTSILNMIIWLATTTASLTTSTSTTTSTTTTSHSLRPRFSLRIRLLRRLLSCSPHLARPLMDATLEAMRSVSEQQLARDCLSTGVAVSDRRFGGSTTVGSLMTLLWAIKCIDKEHRRSIGIQRRTPTSSSSRTTEVESAQLCSEPGGLFESRLSFVDLNGLARDGLGRDKGEKSLRELLGRWEFAGDESRS